MRRTLALMALLLVAVSALALADPQRSDEALLLLVVPVMLAAVRFGARGGLAAAAVACGLIFAWDQGRANLEPLGYLTRGMVFLAVGGALGRFTSSRQSLLQRIARAEELSLDMSATATADGYFQSVNPAWERTLGYAPQALLSRPFLDFVHPEDRQETERQTRQLAGGELVVGFRNRYRAADGSHRWLEWNAIRSTADSLIYAMARDVTVQRQAEEVIRREAEQLEQAVQERTAALLDARLENLTRLALAAEYRDDETHKHTERVGDCARQIAEQLGCDARFATALGLAAPLHDIGKIGIPDHILLKPGRLTDQEFEQIRTHTTIGAAILGDSRSELLQLGEQVALSHHEHWNGGGYPHGLAGAAIPLAGRIVAVADAFDAMTHDRPYKAAVSVPVALDELARCAGTQFDPEVVKAFRKTLGEVPPEPGPVAEGAATYRATRPRADVPT